MKKRCIVSVVIGILMCSMVSALAVVPQIRRRGQFTPHKCFRGILIHLFVGVCIYACLSNKCFCAPYKVDGSYVCATFKNDGSTIGKYTNTFTITLVTNAYKIETINPDSTLPCVVQGDKTECIAITTGVEVKGPNAPDMAHLDHYKLVEIPDVQTGGFPGRGPDVLKVLWVSYLAAQLYGSNWVNYVIPDFKSNIMVKPGIINKKVLAKNIVNVISNFDSENHFVQKAVFYCDPSVTLPDGLSGQLAPPYDKGYNCARYEVTDWKKIENVIAPAKASFMLCQTKFSSDATNADDVIIYTKYELSTVSITPYPATLGTLKCRDIVTTVCDWRLLGIEPIIYQITNSQWRVLSEIPEFEKIRKNKQNILNAILHDKQKQTAGKTSSASDAR